MSPIKELGVFIGLGFERENSFFRPIMIGYAVSSVIAVMSFSYLWWSIYVENPGAIDEYSIAFSILTSCVATVIYMSTQLFVDWRINNDLLSGQLLIDSLLPVSHLTKELGRAFGQFVSYLALIGPAVGAIMLVLLPHQVLSIVHIGSLNVALFLVSIVFSFLILFSIDYLTGLTSFYTAQIWGIASLKESLIIFLGGMALPIAVMPEWLIPFLKATPLFHIFITPTAMMINEITIIEVWLLAKQGIWSFVMLMASHQMYRIAARKLENYSF